MKTRSLTDLSLVLALSALPFASGCTQSSATDAEPALTNIQPAVLAPAGDNSVTAPPEAAAAATPAPRAEPILPPTILPATPLAEVIKLAQSGVDDNVMLSFITNSLKPFDLDAGEIVYLNDLGVSDSVITTMMQHDQELKPVQWKPAQPAAPEPEAEPVAAAPTYVDPPPAAPVAEAQPTYVSNNYFYDSLTPYGNWIEVEGYGRCWQPTVVVGNRNWQPYCDRGRWVYTDAGWYWLSDYSWGATTFHYGRWFTHPSRGWCWWPDTVWAPSWVSWRYSGAYCGWAPLPPAACYQPAFGFSYYGNSVGVGFGFGLAASCYTFVPWGGFCATRPYQYRVPPHQANQVYNNSTVINNYVNGNNNTVINRGISPDRVREHTRTEVRTVNIRDAGTVVGSTGRRERLDHDGRTLVVHRPTLSAPSGSGAAPERSALRTSSPGAKEATVSSRPQTSANIPVARNGRGEVGVESRRANENTAAARVAPAVPSGVASPVLAQTPAASPARVETRSSREPQQRVVGGSPSPGRANSPVAVRPPEVSVPAATATTATPKVNQPRVIQVSPQNPVRPTSAAPAGSLVVIGGKNAPRSSGGRDYSVWSTPSPAPTASASASSPRSSVPAQSAPSPIVSSSPETEYASAPAPRAQGERAVTSRDSHSTFSTPAPTPAPSAPRATSRSEAARPAPSFTPQPASSKPVPSGPRTESRSAPAPARPTVAPERPQSGGTGSSPGQRSR